LFSSISNYIRSKNTKKSETVEVTGLSRVSVCILLMTITPQFGSSVMG
jgi:hypothetical protein